jgi:hypothetical protein
MRLISAAALAALVLFGGCDTEKPEPVTAPASPGDVESPPDTPPPRLLLYADDETRAGVEQALATPGVLAAVSETPRFVPDIRRAFSVTAVEHGNEVQVTFLPLFSDVDPDVLRFVVHARSGATEAVHSVRVRRSAPPADGRFRPLGDLWVALSDGDAGADPGRWTNEQKSDFWTCVIDRSTTTLVSCAVGCIFTAGGWVPCVLTCGGVGELTVVAGCAARVLINTWRGRYDPKEATR